MTGSVHEAPPDGCAWVTTVNGDRWAIEDEGPAFDPIIFQKHVKAADLVLVQGGDAVRVATTNLGAMKKAQAAFAKRAQEEAATALKPLRAIVKKHSGSTGISGVGVQSLLSAVFRLCRDQWDTERMVYTLCVLEEIAPPPADLSEDSDGELAFAAWAGALSAKDAKALLTAIAALGAAGYDGHMPYATDRAARMTAAERKVPWLKDIAESKGGAPVRASAADAADDDDEDDGPEEHVVDFDDDVEED